MPLVIRESLTADNCNVVRHFCCGTTGNWCQYTDAWIKAGVSEDYGAFYSIRRYQTQVWLYFDDVTQLLVGYGSLAPHNIGWPSQNGPRQPCAYIPQMAVDHNFHGQPSELGTTKYCHQIIGDLILEAAGAGRDKLLLHVDPTNNDARGFYQRHGFSVLPGYVGPRNTQAMIKWLQ